MYPNNFLIKWMMLAVDRHDIQAFRFGLLQGFDIRVNIATIHFGWLPFIEIVARTHFVGALRIMLIEMLPITITKDSAYNAFCVSVRTGAPRSVISVFIEAAVLGTLQLLNASECFRYATEYHCHRLARLVTESPVFDPNRQIPTVGSAWETPVHLAVTANDCDSLKKLVERKACIDAANSLGITPLVIASNNLNLDLVKILLTNGADPNSTNVVRAQAWPHGQLLHLQNVPTFPTFKTNLRRSGRTYNADHILNALIAAGLRPSAQHWFHHTQVVMNMSHGSGYKLRNIVYTMPTMIDLAIAQAIQQVRQWMRGKEGPTFNDNLKILYLPNLVKEQLKIQFDN